MADQRTIGQQYARCMRQQGWAPQLVPGSSPPCYVMPLHSLDAARRFSALVPNKAVHVTIVMPAAVDAPLLYLCDCVNMELTGLLATDDLPAAWCDTKRCAHSYALEDMLTDDQKLDLELNLQPVRTLKALDTAAAYGSVVRLPQEWTRGGRCCLSVGIDHRQAILSRAVFVGNSNGLITCSSCKVYDKPAFACEHIHKLQHVRTWARANAVSTFLDAFGSLRFVSDADHPEPPDPEPPEEQEGEEQEGEEQEGEEQEGEEQEGEEQERRPKSYTLRHLHEPIPDFGTCYWCSARQRELQELRELQQLSGLSGLLGAPAIPWAAPEPQPYTSPGGATYYLHPWAPDAADALFYAAQPVDDAVLDREMRTHRAWRLQERLEALLHQATTILHELPFTDAAALTTAAMDQARTDLLALAKAVHRRAVLAMDRAATAYLAKTRAARTTAQKTSKTARAWALQAALGDGCRHCVDEPVPRQCCACQAPMQADPVAAGTTATLHSSRSVLYGQRSCRRVAVFERRCTQYPECKYAEPYDGAGQGVFNMSNSTLYDESVLRDFWNTFFRQEGKTAQSHHEDMKSRYAPRLFVSRTPFTKALYAYTHLLSIRREGACECPACSHLDHGELTVLLDGICLGYSRDKAPAPTAAPTVGSVPTGSNKRFLVVPDAECRKALWAYATATDNAHKAFLDAFALVARHDATMRHVLPLLDLALYHRHHPAIRRFIGFVVRDSPAFGSYVHLGAVDALDTLLHTPPGGAVPGGVIETLRLHFPALHELLTERTLEWPDLVHCPVPDCQPEDRRQPGSILPVLQHLFDIGDALRQLPVEEPVPGLVDDGNIFSPMFEDDFAMPHYEGIRRTDEDCTKYVTLARAVTDGMLLAFCPHGIAIAFIVLTKPEGPMMAFQLFKRRFRKAPAMIIYDNACMLHKVCMLRDPAFFRYTIFCIDRLHGKGHVHCTKGYLLDYLPPDFPVLSRQQLAKAAARAKAQGLPFPAHARPITVNAFRGSESLNSQICEQYNSRLRFIEKSCRHMRRETYWTYITMFMCRWNAMYLSKLYGSSELTVLKFLARQPEQPEQPEPRPKRRRAS